MTHMSTTVRVRTDELIGALWLLWAWGVACGLFFGWWLL